MLAEPVSACGPTLWAPFGPSIVERHGDAVEDPQDGHGIGLTHATLVFLPDDIQNVVGFIFDAPTLPFQSQPILGAQFFGGSRSGQPSVAQSALGTDAAVHASNLKGSGQTQFLGLDAARADSAVLGPSLTRGFVLQLRGEGSLAREFELF